MPCSCLRALWWWGGTGAFFSDEERSEGNVFAAGAIDLTVDSVAHYNGMICFDSGADFSDGYKWHPGDTVVWNETDMKYELRVDIDDAAELTAEIDAFNADNPALVPQAGDECTGTWELRDLGGENLPATTFFSYADLKPGDHGENTISLHVENNDAWACALIDNMVDEEVGDLTEPEAEVDTTEDEGELSQELRFFAWADDGNNVWEENETVLFSNEEGPASDVLDGVSYPLYHPDLNGGAVMGADATQYIGLYWCYGDIEVDDQEYTLSCDGEPVTNLTQMDKLTADIGFYVEQARNNPDFECPGPREREAVVEQGTTWTSVDTDDEGGDNGLTGNDFKRYEWFAKAKVQEPSPASDFELQVGVSDSNGTYFLSDDTEWVSEQEEMFTLTYDGAGTAKLEVDGRPTVTYTVPVSTYGRIGVYVKAPADATTEVYDLDLDLAALTTDNVSATAADNSILISGVNMSSGFTLTGKMKFTWTTLTNNGENQKVQFSID